MVNKEYHHLIFVLHRRRLSLMSNFDCGLEPRHCCRCVLICDVVYCWAHKWQMNHLIKIIWSCMHLISLDYTSATTLSNGAEKRGWTRWMRNEWKVICCCAYKKKEVVCPIFRTRDEYKRERERVFLKWWILGNKGTDKPKKTKQHQL